ncbi:MAG TPA: hypothetical protein VJR23_15755 [Candidatus Acidoferrales bacterium]|nr:hypothetical protein [Candidatus Acidoferrales bacterium]
MMFLVFLALTMLCGAPSGPQSGATSQSDMDKISQESQIDCAQGRVIGLDGVTPVRNAVIRVRRVKYTFPHPHLSTVNIQEGKEIARLRVDQEGHVNFSNLKSDEYFLDLSVPEGSVSSLFHGFGKLLKKDCTVDLQVTKIQDTLLLRKRAQ